MNLNRLPWSRDGRFPIGEVAGGQGALTGCGRVCETCKRNATHCPVSSREGVCETCRRNAIQRPISDPKVVGTATATAWRTQPANTRNGRATSIYFWVYQNRCPAGGRQG